MIARFIESALVSALTQFPAVVVTGARQSGKTTLARAMEKVGAYENLTGYIDHVSHPQSEAAGSDANPYYHKNFVPTTHGQNATDWNRFRLRHS